MIQKLIEALYVLHVYVLYVYVLDASKNKEQARKKTVDARGLAGQCPD